MHMLSIYCCLLASIKDLNEISISKVSLLVLLNSGLTQDLYLCVLVFVSVVRHRTLWAKKNEQKAREADCGN